MKVKICGITNLEDALAAAEYGADAVGFVFAPESPRYVSPGTVRKIISALPPFIVTVAVFTEGSERDFRSALDECGVDLIQFHGPTPPEVVHLFSNRAIKAIRVRDVKSLDEMSYYPVRAILLDSYHEKTLGGSGVAFNWEIAKRAQKFGRIILAGGLTSENVAEAVARVRPYGVDISSGVEIKKGKKDFEKLKRFIHTAKEAEKGDHPSQ